MTRQESRNLVPGVGIGDMTFGMSRQQAKDILGLPSGIEEGDLNGTAVVAWSYEHDTVKLRFEMPWDRLTCVEVSGRKTRLLGERFFGRSPEQVAEALASAGHAPELEAPTRWRFGEHGICLSVADGRVVSVEAEAS